MDRIIFQNGKAVSSAYLNEVQKGNRFTGDTRTNYYSDATASDEAGWEIGQRDSIKDWEIADPREDQESALGRSAHDGIVLGWDEATQSIIVPGVPSTRPAGSGGIGVTIEAGSLVTRDGNPVSWSRQNVQILGGAGSTSYIYVLESGSVSIGNSLPSVTVPHIPLAKIVLNETGDGLATDPGTGEVVGYGYLDIRPNTFVGNLNTYPQNLTNTEIKNFDYTAEIWDRVIADTSNGSIILTLPNSPVDSDRIAVVDISGTFDRFPLIIRTNPESAELLNNSSDDWIVNIRDAHLELFYHEATGQWKFEEAPGSECNPVLGTFLSCGGREFIGDRTSEECPDGGPLPARYPEPSAGTYSFEPSQSDPTLGKCYRVYNGSVALFANGTGGLIGVPSAPRCDRSGTATISATRNTIFVDPSIGDDSVGNAGFDPGRPFRTLERALIEAVRESRRSGQANDRYDRVMIELAPGDYYVDNSPGSLAPLSITDNTGLIQRVSTGYSISSINTGDRVIHMVVDVDDPVSTQPPMSFNLGRVIYSQSGGVGNISRIEKTSASSSNWIITLEYVNGPFNVNDELFYDNLASVNPQNGGLIVPRGISIDGTDLRKVRLRPMYVPEMESSRRSAILKVTGGTYVSLLTFTDNPQYARSHNTVTSVTFASEEEIKGSGTESSYYGRLNSLFKDLDGWGAEGLEPIPAETTIVAPIVGDKLNRSQDIEENQTGLLIEGGDSRDNAPISYPGATRIRDTDGSILPLPDINSTRSSSPYVFNCSVRSIFGLNGLWADGKLVKGFKSMVTANFTQVSLQTDPNCFLPSTYFQDPPTNKESGQGKQYKISNTGDVFKYRHFGMRGSSDATIQIVSVFVIGNSDHFVSEDGADLSITNSCSDFGDISLRSIGYKEAPFSQDEGVSTVGYSGTRLAEVIPPLPLRYACKKDVNGNVIDDGNCFVDRTPTLVDTEINTGLIINYELTEQNVIANTPGAIPATQFRVYFSNSDNANQFSLNNPPSSSNAAFGQFSYTKKVNGTYVHAGGVKYVNRRRIYISGFDEEGNSILYAGDIQIASDQNVGFSKLDDKSKVFEWDEENSSWYFKVDTTAVVEEIEDNDGDGYLLKKIGYAFRYKVAPLDATISSLDFIFDRSSIRIVRAIDSRKNDERVYRVVLSGFDRAEGIRRPQPYYVVERQAAASTEALNGSPALSIDPLTITQVTRYNDIYRPGVQTTLDNDKYVTYLTTGSNARQVFTSDVFPIIDLDEPELTEDPSDSITKVALELLQERPGVVFEKPIAPGLDKFQIKASSTTNTTGILINLRRPSVIRASGHTWEWTGYLNYDTAFPTFQGDPLEADYALGKIIVEENGGRVYATGMNEEGSYYIGTTVFDLRSGEQFAIPLKADSEPGNITNQVLNNVIIKNTLLMNDDSRIILQDGTQIILHKNTEIVANTGPITPDTKAKSYATTEYAGFVQLAKRQDVEGARNLVGLQGVSDKVVVSALQLAQELDTRLSGFISPGTGVSVVVTPNNGGTTDDASDDFNTFEVSIGQDVAETADVTFNSVTAAENICAFSDARLKDNITTLSDSLARVEKLREVSYELKSNPGTVQLGLIAQEVKDIIPEVVSQDKESDMYKISYQSLIPLLIGAVKELSERVKKLEGN